MKGFLTSLQFLTIIRIKEVQEDFSSSLYWFPAIGLLLGLIFYSISFIGSRFIRWNIGIAFCILCVEIIITGALHIDGLSDWADSLGVSGKENKIRVMKDPHVGSFGIIAITLAILGRLVALSEILASKKLPCIIIVPAISRAMMVEMCATMPYAKANGKGKAFVFEAKAKHRLCVMSLTALICLFFYKIKGIILFFLSIVLISLLKNIFKRQLSGITGDLLGTTNEIIAVLLLFIGAII